MDENLEKLEYFDELYEKYQGDELVIPVLSNLDSRESVHMLQNNREFSLNQAMETYVQATEDVYDLHNELTQCSNVLDNLGSMVLNLKQGLLLLGDDLGTLVKESEESRHKLKNRQLLTSQVSTFTNDVLISEDLIKDIIKKDIDEHYIEYLYSLDKRDEWILKQKKKKKDHDHDHDGMTSTPIIVLLEEVISKLRDKAKLRIREFLLHKIKILSKPNTNIQILQQSIGSKYGKLFEFLVRFHPPFAAEINQYYIDTVTEIFEYYFKTYITTLISLKMDVGDKNDLIGILDNTRAVSSLGGSGGISSSGSFSIGSVQHANVFSLGERAKLLDNYEIIVTHVALEEGKGVQFPRIFASCNRLLVSTVISEYWFQINFFLQQVR
eukprot:TRINITY_DN6679_c0_g1_i1.p1 TRINITY_DN6679_c0_g1~~TRINITY_DN6679_c0_g1_i1.p1  ORF type:complete len:382 (-),score=82.11 TRINITY_DN6679_c0_g1_i1:1038-2183(-)